MPNMSFWLYFIFHFIVKLGFEQDFLFDLFVYFKTIFDSGSVM